MKLILLFILVCLSAPSFGALCKVYGISDSPQKLDCSFGQNDIQLRCKNGQYYINNLRVDSAYHLEVEDGPVPLVFKTKSSELTVLIQSKVDIEAEYSTANRTRMGTCI